MRQKRRGAERKVNRLWMDNSLDGRYDHKIETSLEGIEHLSKDKKEKERRKMKEKNHYYLRDTKLLDF